VPSPNDNNAMGRVRHIHFVGVGGAGMSGIAEVLHNLGYEVSGSDLQHSAVTRHLQELGVRVTAGHDATLVNGCDVIVISSAVAADNPEVAAARSLRIPVIPRAEMLAELMRFRHGIAVAGTHGKTTTTSLIASVLTEGGLDPTYVIGGRLNSGKSNARLGSGAYLVAEADESDASFLHLQPVMAVLTNIDADHMDTYGGDYRLLQENFIRFLQHLPFYGLAVLCADDAGVREIMPRLTKPFITYGIHEKADYTATYIRHGECASTFTVSGPGGDEPLQIRLNMPGDHNVQNALAAIIVAKQLDVPDLAISRALAGFEGIARRCDILGNAVIDGKQVLIIDDYAHHPREILAILEALRAGWPGRRVVVIFQPHRYTRTRDLFEDFCQVLSGMEVLIMLDVYAAGEAPIPGADARDLCRALRLRGGVEPLFVEDRGEIAAMLPALVGDGDILLILGAGDIGSLGPELMTQYSGSVH
jgi:UDP-N-acetylmuramate--alanine ligase